MLTKLLVGYSTLLTTALAAYTFAGGSAARVQQFDEIDVHRINVREDDGASSQFVQLAGIDDSQNHIVGLVLSDTDATGNRRRIVIGHDKEGVASVSLMDRNGRKRILWQVAPDGTPSIVFLDADGKVVNQIGPPKLP